MLLVMSKRLVKSFSATGEATDEIAPKPQFLSLTEAAVLAVLDDPDPANPIAIDVTRLMAGYAEHFLKHVRRIRFIPADILRVQPRSPIEAVAMRFTTRAIRLSLAEPESSGTVN